MDQIYYILKNENLMYFILFFLFFLLGWLMRKIYKLFIFLKFIFLGKLGEKKARNLLIKNGYEILEEQLTLKGKLLENKKMRFFFIKPDFLVKKNNIIYIAEVKTGKSASIKDRNTRRQLLEYVTNLKSNKALLIDISKKSISYIEFL